jgi:hypothetical protein
MGGLILLAISDFGAKNVNQELRYECVTGLGE